LFFAVATAWVGIGKADLTVTTDLDSQNWPVPGTNNVIANGPAMIEGVPDSIPDGLYNSGVFLESINLGGGKFVSQTFKPSASFKLGAICMYGNGMGTFDTSTPDPNDHLPLGVHLYELVSGTAGAGSLPASYNLSTAGAGDTAATDLFGGGAGLSFQYDGSAQYQFVDLNFSGADQVQLEAGHVYSFEIWGNSLSGAFNPQRLAAGATVNGMGPNPYAGGDGYQAADSALSTDRSQPQSASRDMMIAIYEAIAPQGQPGDFDGDGDVDGADFVAWQTHYPLQSGATLATGDADNDQDVDGADFAIWQANFPLAPASEVAAVPEPSAILLAALTVPALAGFRRLRRKAPAGRKQLRGRALSP
jgi:hypothetical protein